jgi:acyl dehydratase
MSETTGQRYKHFGEKWFDELEVGDVYECGGRTINAADFNQYISLAGNYGQLHVNKKAAQERGHDERVAHGFAIMGMVNQMGVKMYKRPGGGLYGYDKIRFIKPIHLGETIEIEVEITEKEEFRDNIGKVHSERTAYNDDGEAVIYAEAIHLVAKESYDPSEGY